MASDVHSIHPIPSFSTEESLFCDDRIWVSSFKSKGTLVQRSIHMFSPVSIYRNLNKSGSYLSVVANTGEFKHNVVGYAQAVVVAKPTFKVSEAGRQRVLATGQKNVHAKVVSNAIVDVSDSIPTDLLQYDLVSYNPYLEKGFYYHLRDAMGDSIPYSRRLVEADFSPAYAIVTARDVLIPKRDTAVCHLTLK